MLKCIIHLTVYHLLVEFGIRIFPARSATYNRQAHHSIAKDRYTFFGLRIYTICHLTLGRFAIVAFAVYLVLTFACREQCG